MARFTGTKYLLTYLQYFIIENKMHLSLSKALQAPLRKIVCKDVLLRIKINQKATFRSLHSDQSYNASLCHLPHLSHLMANQ